MSEVFNPRPHFKFSKYLFYFDKIITVRPLQNSKIFLEKYNNVEFSIFYSKYIDTETYIILRNNALRIMYLFGSTYACEHMFSRTKVVKSKTKARLTYIHLENSLKIASPQIQPNIEKLVNEKQCQLSH